MTLAVLQQEVNERLHVEHLVAALSTPGLGGRIGHVDLTAVQVDSLVDAVDTVDAAIAEKPTRNPKIPLLKRAAELLLSVRKWTSTNGWEKVASARSSVEVGHMLLAAEAEGGGWLSEAVVMSIGLAKSEMALSEGETHLLNMCACSGCAPLVLKGVDNDNK